jgi:hypothetical protein
MNLYQAQDDIDLRGILDHVQVKVTEQMREWLGRSFSADEVEKVLFLMKLSKAPGTDGFNASFYQRHWQLIREDVVAAVLGFLQGWGAYAGGDQPDHHCAYTKGKKSTRNCTVHTDIIMLCYL